MMLDPAQCRGAHANCVTQPAALDSRKRLERLSRRLRCRPELVFHLAADRDDVQILDELDIGEADDLVFLHRALQLYIVRKSDRQCAESRLRLAGMAFAQTAYPLSPSSISPGIISFLAVATASPRNLPLVELAAD